MAINNNTNNSADQSQLKREDETPPNMCAELLTAANSIREELCVLALLFCAPAAAAAAPCNAFVGRTRRNNEELSCACVLIVRGFRTDYCMFVQHMNVYTHK